MNVDNFLSYRFSSMSPFKEVAHLFGEQGRSHGTNIRPFAV